MNRYRLAKRSNYSWRVRNRHIHFLGLLNALSSSGFDTEIEDLKRLVRVRDCVVHSAGFLEGEAHDRDIREAIKALKGFTIWKENLLGTSIHIEKGAIERYAEMAKDWIPKLVERSVKAGLIRT